MADTGLDGIILTGTLKESVTGAITAFAGGGITNAVQLSTGINVIATVATAGDSVKLPPAVDLTTGAQVFGGKSQAPFKSLGTAVKVVNNGANPCNVFPNSATDAINSIAAGSAFSLPPGQIGIFFCSAATAWTAITLAASNVAGGFSQTPTSGAGVATANGGTISSSAMVSRINPTANVTGAIIAAGAAGGQPLFVINESAFIVAFNATDGTSNVLNGANLIIPANGTAEFFWDANLARWVPENGPEVFGVTPASGAGTAIANAGTIPTATEFTKIAPTANVTGIILAAGLYNGQFCMVQNESAFLAAFNGTDATSNVLNGGMIIIPANGAVSFVWNASLSRWLPENGCEVFGQNPPGSGGGVAIVTGGTIVTTVDCSRVNPVASVTGMILAAGLYGSQTCLVVNESAFSVAFATDATSNVKNGLNIVVPPGGSTLFIWDNNTLLWSVDTGAQTFGQLPVSGAGTAIVTGGTISVLAATARLNPAANVTGIIITPGLYAGQVLNIVNDSLFNITFAVQATSNLIGGASNILQAQQAWSLVWDNQLALWVPLNSPAFVGAPGNIGTHTVVKSLSGIADGVATLLATITIPNQNGGGGIRVSVTGVQGDGDSSDSFIQVIQLARVAGANTKSSLGVAKLDSNAIVGSTSTVVVTLTLSGLAGAVGATQTLNLNVTVARSAGASTNHTALAEITVLNPLNTGITVA